MAIEADDIDAEVGGDENDPPLTRRELRERAAEASADETVDTRAEPPAHELTESPAPELAEPPAQDFADLVDEAPAEPPTPPLTTDAIQTVERTRWTRGLLVLAASLVVLVGLGFAAARIGDVIYPGPPAVAALEQIEAADDGRSASAAADAGGEALLHWSDSVGEAVLVVNGLPLLDEGELYRAWFLRGETSTPAGVVATDAEGPASTLLTGAIAEGDVVTITVETDAAEDQPTTEPIVRISTD